MGGTNNHTLTHIDESTDEPLASGPQLYVGLDCERPLATTAQISLGKVDEVAIVRNGERRFERDGRRVTVRLPDKWMSASHARITRAEGGFVLEDVGSKNGTLLNGAPCHKSVLASGDIIEVGHTVLLFREALAAAEPLEVVSDRLHPPLPEMATFVAPLAVQFRALAQVARRPLVSVVVLGATGTGKELAARALHQLSGRQGAFIAVNCGSISASLFEAELFGYKKGAFTGASEDRPGLIRAADGGTLFLDEVGDLSPASQTSLLRVLQEREVLAVGATKPVKVDLRVVAATHRDLQALADSGKFRPDLLARLGGFKIELPELKDRREDLGLLIAALLRRVAPDPEQVRFTCKAARALFRYTWPLNIRELEKCLGSATALAGDKPVDVGHLADGVRAALLDPEAIPAAALTPEERQRRDELVQLFRQHEGNVAAVARAMGKAPMQIHRWIKRYGLSLDDLRRAR